MGKINGAPDFKVEVNVSDMSDIEINRFALVIEDIRRTACLSTGALSMDAATRAERCIRARAEDNKILTNNREALWNGRKRKADFA